MNLHKVKSFRCYQAVKMKHDMVNYFIADDKNSRISLSHEVFFAPVLASMILKCKGSGAERFIPLTNIQDFELFESVIHKAAPFKEEDSADAPAETPAQSEDADEGEDFQESPVEPPEEAPKKKVTKKAAKKVTKKVTPKV